MSEPILTPTIISIAARVIPSAMLGAGKSLLKQGPVERAIKRLEISFPTMRGQLRQSVRAWISDEAVLSIIKEVQIGGPRTEVTESLIDAFLRHSAIPELTRDAAERFIAAFFPLLEQEAAKEDFGPWRQENIIRHEFERTRHELRQGLSSIGSQLAEFSRNQIGEPAELEEQEGDYRAHQRIDEANRLFRRGNMRSALASYRQILSETDESYVEPRIRFRLHSNIGSCLIALGQWEDARSHFQLARDAAPGEPLPHAQLGQIELHSGRVEQARAHAQKAIQADPENLIAWIILLQSDEGTKPNEVPESVQGRSEFWLARAKKAFRSKSLDEAEAFARKALSRSDRTPQQLVEVAEMFQLVNAVLPGSRVPHEVRQDILRLVSEALEKLDEHERPNLAAHARTLRGINQLPEASEDAVEDLRRAIALDPAATAPRLGLAQVLVAADDYEGALFVLREMPTDIVDARVSAFRARAMAYARLSNREVEAELLRALDNVDAGLERQALLLDLIDTATRVGSISVAEQMLDELGDDAVPAAVSVMRARIAGSRGEDDRADEEYRAAIAAADNEVAREVRIELAGFRLSRGKHGPAVDVFQEVEAIKGPDWLRRSYAQALIGASRWKQLQGLIDRLRTEGALPDWGLDAASNLALQRDDLTSARTYLTELISRDVAAPVASLRLAYALLRMGEVDEAVSVLLSVPRERLDAPNLSRLARLLFRTREYEAAVRAAYEAWRKNTADPELVALLAITLFQSPDDLAIAQDPEEVGPETWVRLEALDGSEDVCFLFTSDEPIPGRVEEIRADSKDANILLGARINDRVILRPGDIDPVEYRVREIKSAYVHAAQEAATRVRTRIGDEALPLQAIRVGSPESIRFLTPFISVLYQSEASRERALELYHERRLPLGCIAGMAGGRLRQAYLHLTGSDRGPLHVESGTSASLAAAALAAQGARQVVISASALFTLQRLDMLQLLAKMYDRVIVPPSLPDQLRQERRDLEEEIERGVIRRMGPGPKGIEVSELSPDVVRPEVHVLDMLLQFIESESDGVPRPLELGEHAERIREMLGEAEADTLLAASADRPLYADDEGLRALAAADRNAPSFSTYAFLEAAEQRALLTKERRLEAVLELIQLQHVFIPISADLLLAALRIDGLALGPKFRTALDRLAPANANIGSSLPVAAALVREVANAPLAGGIFRGVVWRILDVFYEARNRAETLSRLDKMIEGALGLLPMAHHRYIRERDAFLRVKQGLR